MLSLTSLRCFTAAAEAMNFSRAAKEMYISQQALSHHISKLEENLGVKLFARSNPLALTDAGRILYKYSLTILQDLDNCNREINDIKDFRYGTLNIGIPVTRGTLMLPHLLSTFHRKFPHVQLNLLECDTPELLASLNTADIDLFIGWLPENDPKYRFIPLYTEDFAILIPNEFLDCIEFPDGISNDVPLPITQFSKIPFIAQSMHTMNGQVFLSLCQEYDMHPEIILTTTNLLTQIALCMEGMGACVVPMSFILQKAFVSKNTLLFNPSAMKNHTIYIIDTHSIVNKSVIGICRKKDRILTRAGKEFVSIAKALFSETF